MILVLLYIWDLMSLSPSWPWILWVLIMVFIVRTFKILIAHYLLVFFMKFWLDGLFCESFICNAAFLLK
jgi:hypothetical protein